MAYLSSFRLARSVLYAPQSAASNPQGKPWIGDGLRRQTFPQGEPSPKSVTDTDDIEAVKTHPPGAGHRREFPPLLDLSDDMSVPLSKNILPPTAAFPQGGGSSL